MHPSAPHSALQLHKPALPRAPLQHVQQKCPQACRTLPSPHTACQRKATKQPLATVPPFFIYMLGSSVISTGSADVIPGIHLAQCGPSHSQLKRRKEVAAILQSYVQEVARAAPGWGCVRPIKAWTELRTRTDRRTNWWALAQGGGGCMGKGAALEPPSQEGLRAKGRTTHSGDTRRSEHVPNIYTFYVTYI